MLSNSLIPLPHRALLLRLGLRAKAERLSKEMTRRELARRSEVKESAIKRFETTGEIGVSNLLSLLVALGISDQLEALFAPKLPATLAQLQVGSGSPRLRGLRSDHGKPRVKEPVDV